MNNVFDGLKVLELASVLAGPAVGMFFSELGANVIKIENKKTGGDVTRNWKLEKEHKDAKRSAYYCSINWNKEVLFLDLSIEEDRYKVYALVKTADVVLANYRKSSAIKLKMDYASLKAINSKIIYGNISGFGEDSERVAFDVVLQAESGFMFMNGQPGGLSTKMPVALIDILAAHHLKEGILIALLKRIKTGNGAYISVSLLDAAISSLANQASNWLMSGHIPQKMGSLHPNIAPYGELFTTNDGKELVLAIGTDRQFQALCTYFNRHDLADNPSYSSNEDRVKNRTQLFHELRQNFQSSTLDDILTYCIKNNIPVGQVRNMKDVFEDKQTSDMILTEQIGDFITKTVSSLAFRIS